MEAQQTFSIIVPTYREAKNIPALAARIANLNQSQETFELILVDDHSQDGIDTVVRDLQSQYPWLMLLQRQGKRSLSESVIDGIKAARFPMIIIMDADLSHPPEKIPAMLALLRDPIVDIVIGSRYVAGGSTDEVWPLKRRLISKLAALVARLLLSTDVKDPLSGFIAVRKSTCFAGGALTPVGWKISLEIMVKAHCKTIKEI